MNINISTPQQFHEIIKNKGNYAAVDIINNEAISAANYKKQVSLVSLVQMQERNSIDEFNKKFKLVLELEKQAQLNKDSNDFNMNKTLIVKLVSYEFFPSHNI